MGRRRRPLLLHSRIPAFSHSPGHVQPGSRATQQKHPRPGTPAPPTNPDSSLRDSTQLNQPTTFVGVVTVATRRGPFMEIASTMARTPSKNCKQSQP